MDSMERDMTCKMRSGQTSKSNTRQYSLGIALLEMNQIVDGGKARPEEVLLKRELGGDNPLLTLV